MIITYYGIEFFRLQHGDLVLAFNPPAKDSSAKTQRFGADIVLTSMDHADFNGLSEVSYGEKTPFAITGPGEYEVCGVSILGVPTLTRYDEKERINTVYYLTLEGVGLCFLGALGRESELNDEAREKINNTDILFTPIGGSDVFAPNAAHKVSRSLSPKIIIPMHYKPKSEQLKRFLDEAGARGVKPLDKLTIKRKEVEGKDGEIVVLGQ